MKSIKSIEPAVTICEFDPYVSLLSRKYRGSLCDGCFKENKLTPCRKCSVFKYCSTECEEKNEKNHRYECSILEKNPSKMNEIDDDVLFLLRLYYYSESIEGKEASDTFLEKTRRFYDLMSHEENIKKDALRRLGFETMSGAIANFVRDQLAVPDKKRLFATFGKAVINDISIVTDDVNCLGTGLYLGASGLDHDCNPNCVVTFSDKKLVLRSSMKINKDEELTITYIEEARITNRRRVELLEKYYFCCNCKYCTDHDRDAKMIGLLPGEEMHREAIDQECAQMESTVRRLKNLRDYQEVYEISKKFFSKWSKKLRPQSIYVFKCLDLYFDACANLNMWDKAVHNAPKMFKLHKRYFPNPHPQRAIDYMRCARILLHTKSYAKAMEYFEKAEKEINAVYGPNSSMACKVAQYKFRCILEGRQFE